MTASQVIDHPINDVTSLNQEIARFVTELRDRPEKLDISRLITFCLTIHDFVLKNKTFSGLNEKGVFDYDHNYCGIEILLSKNSQIEEVGDICSCKPHALSITP